MKHDYLDITKKIILRHLDTNQYKVFLFGSRAVGNAKEMSDIDVGIKGDKPLSIHAKSQIEDELEESIVPFKVDIVDFYNVSEKFKHYALEKVVVWN